MGRVSPPKVFSGQSVSDGDLNKGIAEFDVQSQNIDELNVCDEALGFEELQPNSFVRNFSLWGGKGPSRLISDHHESDASKTTYAKSRVVPQWRPDDSYSLNGDADLPNRPHVKITNNPDNGDVTIVRVSCGIYMDDYGFQTLRRTFANRFKGPIIGCSLGFSDEASTDGSHYTRLNSTRQWFQLPWSGAKWNHPPRPGGSSMEFIPEGYGSPARYLSADHLDGWFDTPTGGGKQWVTPDQWVNGDPTESAMSFCYNFNYQSTYVWKPSGTGNKTGVFALMTLATFDPLGDKPFWSGTQRTDSGTREYSWEADSDGDGVGDEDWEDRGVAHYRFVRQGGSYPGFYIRNCSINAITYTMGR
mgnify:CR=1 FL=1